MQDTSAESAPAERLLIEAIATRRLVTADYNARTITLAPHLLFERHGDLFIGAYNPAKSRRSDEEPSLGYFKLKGLSNIALSPDNFEPLEAAAQTLPRDEDKLIFAV